MMLPIGGTGGGISISGGCSAEILDNVISNNVSSNGGGIGMSGAGTPIIKRNVIKGNGVPGVGQGGGIYMVNDSDALIVQNLITGNQASSGGGIYWLVRAHRGPISSITRLPTTTPPSSVPASMPMDAMPV